MALRFDLPDRIPLFPLPGAVLMPRARMPLHLFEPRYLQLLEDTLKTDHRLIGMIQPEGDGLSAIGCAGRVDWSSFGRDLSGPEQDPTLDRKALFSLLDRYMQTQELSTDWDAAAEAEDELLINSLSMMLPFTPGDKQALLESPTLADRRELLVGLIEFALHGGENEERLQ